MPTAQSNRELSTKGAPRRVGSPTVSLWTWPRQRGGRIGRERGTQGSPATCSSSFRRLPRAAPAHWSAAAEPCPPVSAAEIQYSPPAACHQRRWLAENTLLCRAGPGAETPICEPFPARYRHRTPRRPRRPHDDPTTTSRRPQPPPVGLVEGAEVALFIAPRFLSQRSARWPPRSNSPSHPLPSRPGRL
jgi:hypothetical protein